MQGDKKVPSISLLGTTALLFEAPGALDITTQQRIWALANIVAKWSETREAVPGMNNMMLVFAIAPADPSELRQRLIECWQTVEPLSLQGRIIELPVVYGGQQHGPHMEDVIAHTGLSCEQIAELHSQPLYPVYALGSHPGFCYLGGMDARLATPRRETPIVNLPAGSVSIGGIQTAVSASAGPSGWNTIGVTRADFFDLSREPPVLCEPGDVIRFCIDKVIV